MNALLSGWRRDLVNWLLSGGYVAIVLLGFQLESREGWFFVLGLTIPASLWAWHGNLKRYRMIVDTPTSRVVSAPQGYVELVGTGRQQPGDTLLHPFTHLPCLWYRYRIEERRNNRWFLVDSGESYDTFGLDDGSGMVLIDPEGAEILCTRKQVMLRDNRRHTDWSLLAGDTLYVLGEHLTLGSHEAVSSRRERLSEILGEWKRNPAELLRRFDADGNGEIDLSEWETARQAAVALLDTPDRPPREEIRLLRQPRDGRPFLVANRDVTELARHYRRWSAMHLVALALAAYGLLTLA